MRKSWPLLVFCMLMLFSSATAIGIAPATMSITLQPGAKQTITYYAVNNGNAEVEAEAYIEAQFLQNIKILESPKFKIPPNTLKSFTINFVTPKNLPKGSYDIAVGIREISGGTSEGLAAKVAAQSLLHLDNPNGIPKLMFSIATTNLSVAGTPAYFYIKAENGMDAAIGPVQGSLVISDSKGKEVYRTDLQTISSIQPKSSARISAAWEKTAIGRYNAVANFNYAGQTDFINTTLQVGKPSIEILGINVTQQNSFATVLTTVKSKWVEPMQVHSEVMGYYKGTFVGSGTSNVVKLEPNQLMQLKTIVDIKTWQVEDLDFDVIVFFDGHTTQQSVTAEGYFSEQYQGLPMGAAISSELGFEFKPTYLIAVLLIVIAFILYRFYNEEDRRFGR